MPDKDESSKNKWAAPKPAASPPSSDKVDFGAVRHAVHLKKTILKMDHDELTKYSKQIGVSYDHGNKIDFLYTAITKYNSQQ